MQVSSDTIRGTSVNISSTLRHEELDDLLVMDWWFDTDMAKDTQKSATVEDLNNAISGLKKSIAQQVEKGIKDGVDQKLSIKTKWWKSPLPVGVVCALISAAGTALVEHVRNDSTRDMELAVQKRCSAD